MHLLKNGPDEPICRASRETETRRMDCGHRAEAGAGTNWEGSTGIDPPPCVKQTAFGKLPCRPELSSLLWMT